MLKKNLVKREPMFKSRLSYHLIVFFLVFISSSVVAEKSTTASDEKLLEEARQHIKLKQFSQAKTILLSLASDGNADAQYDLGVLFRNGYILRRDDKQAFYWFEKAAKKSHAKSIFAIGMMKFRGSGITQDLKAAEKLFVISAKLGHKPARVKLDQLRKEKANKVLSDRDYIAFRKAIRTGNVARVKRFIKRGIDIDKSDINGNTSFIIAVDSNQKAIIKLLSRRNPDFTAKNSYGETALMIAIKNGYSDSAKFLVSNRRVVNAINLRDKLGNSALLLAVKYELDSLVPLLIQVGSDITVKDLKNRDSYQIAEDKGKSEIKQHLLEAGYKKSSRQKIKPFVVQDDPTSVDEKNPYANWSALMLASWRGDIQAVGDLVRTTENINRVDESGYSALSRASWKGSSKIVKLLLDNGADVGFRLADGSTALHLACANGHFEVVKMLIENNVNINLQRKDGKTALMLAATLPAEEPKSKIAQYLISKSGNASLQDEHGKTALMYAVKAGNIMVVEHLLSARKTMDIKDSSKRSALWYAVNYNKPDIVQLLLGANADANQVDNEGNTLLTKAVVLGNEELVKHLLHSNAKVDVETLFGNTPLIVAASNGDEKIIKLLIVYKADVDHKNSIGDTALITAAKNGHTELAEFLVNVGSNLSLKNKQRQTALSIAKSTNNEILVKILEERKRELGFWQF